MATPHALLLLCALLVSGWEVAQAALTSADAAPQFETSSGRKLLTDTRLGAHLPRTYLEVHCVGACEIHCVGYTVLARVPLQCSIALLLLNYQCAAACRRRWRLCMLHGGFLMQAGHDGAVRTFYVYEPLAQA